MAIIVDEGKKKSNLPAILAWVVFIGIALVAVYYVFFAAPTLVNIPASGKLSTIAPIVSAKLDPQTVVGQPQFQALQSTITVPTPQSPNGTGRPNPFIAP